jgi:arylsulfatase A-like enzyme
MVQQGRRVLLITLDQWRGDCLSAVGHPVLRTPNVDQLAAEGFLFRRHYGQATPCGPARASLFTGLYLHNHRSIRNGTPLDRRHANLASEARKAGIHPVLFGYTDTSVDPRYYPASDPALTTYEGILPGFSAGTVLTSDLRPWLTELRRRGYDVAMSPDRQHEIWLPDRDNDDHEGWGPSFAPARYKSEDSDTNFLTDRIIDFLAANAQENSLILASYLRPHPPLIAPVPYHALYRASDMPAARRRPTRDEEALQHPWLARHIENLYRGGAPIQEDVPLANLDERAWRQLTATYLGLITEVDDTLGRLFAAMKSLGLYHNTFIVVTADHGDQLGDHWLIGKEGYYDASFHVPLIIRDPQADGGRVIDAFTEAVDIMPTILEWLGSEPPKSCDGRSLFPLMLGTEPRGWRNEVHWAYDFRDLREPGAEAALGLGLEDCGVSVIRDTRYKYVHFSSLPPLFFDLTRDPFEFDNRADDPNYARLVLAYAQKMLSWRMHHEDRTLSHLHLGPGGVYSRK